MEKNRLEAFSDGSPFTAADVEYTLIRAITHPDSLVGDVAETTVAAGELLAGKSEWPEGCELLAAFEKEIDENRKNGGITIASGYARFDPALDKSTRTVIERADEKMYKRKRELKGEKR
ncbi:MAG: hypothetical protein IJU16_07640 [Clostridia bacterium]|nr:hypothetical protein [Clostridia bacterium]